MSPTQPETAGRHFPPVVRSAEPGLLDTMLVVAVLTILTIRVYLKAAHYPQVGGGGLHVAHVLWGGLGMVIALVLLLAFLTSTTQRLAAVVGGIGFGAFVDELGKFLTSDNNYFFKPTAALIYTVFVALFLLARQIRRVRRLTPEESLVNAIEISKDLALERLSFTRRDQALLLLHRADQANPLVPQLRREFMAAECIKDQPSWVTRMSDAAQRRYVRLISTNWFHRAFAILFIVQAFSAVVGALTYVVLGVAVLFDSMTAGAAMNDAGVAGVSSGLQAAASLVSGAFTVVGVVQLRRNRMQAYRWFEFAVLLDLFLGQPVTLLSAGFAGLAEVFFDLALLATLRYMITQEHQLKARTAAGARRSSATQPGALELA